MRLLILSTLLMGLQGAVAFAGDLKPVCQDSLNPWSKVALSAENQKIVECRYLACSVKSSETELDDAEIVRCSNAYETVFQKIYNKNFKAMLEWWQPNKTREAALNYCKDTNWTTREWKEYLPFDSNCDDIK